MIIPAGFLLIIAIAIVGQYREYEKFNNICATWLPDKVIKFEYIFHSDNKIAGTFTPVELKIRLSSSGKFTDREKALWHEIGHAIIYYIYEINRYDFNQIINEFTEHSSVYGKCEDYNWNHWHVSKYACSDILEDIAETYSNVMTKSVSWNRDTKLKALMLCKIAKKYNIVCDL